MANSQGGKIKRPVGFVRNGSLFRQMASVAAKRWVGLLLAFYAVATDRLTGWNGMGFAMRGLLDEPAHLATAIVILGALIRIRRAIPDHRFGWTMLACSVLIDIDHLPAEFGSDVLTSGTPRPYIHALWTVIVLTLAWAIARFFVMRSGRPHPATIELLLAGAASGVAAHFVRDITTAPMSFCWPISDIAVQVPYWWYVLALAIIIAIGPVENHLRLTYATFDAPPVLLPFLHSSADWEPPQNPGQFNLAPGELNDLYTTQRLSLKVLGRRFGTSGSTIATLLSEYGIPRRTPAEAARPSQSTATGSTTST